MHFISVLLFTISANIDNFTVALSYGIKKIKIGIWSNILVAIISSIGTFISMSIGLFISKLISINITNILGSTILIAIGIWFLIDFFINQKNKKDKDSNNSKGVSYRDILTDPEKADIDNSKYIDVKESITLALALTINNFGLGIGASITGLNIFLTTGFTFIFSILAIFIGYFLGNSYLCKLLGKYASLVSALIIIVLGVYEMFV